MYSNVPHLLLILLLRYFVIAGAFYWVYYILLRNKIHYRKIQFRLPTPSDYQREILFSLLTTVIFLMIGIITFHPNHLRPYTQIYDEFGSKGWSYEIFSFFMILIVHDTYFYWCHRVMHSRWGMKYIHLTHHKSVNPSPWAAFSFSPLEAIIEAGIILVVAFLFPIHRNTILIFMVFMTLYNVYGHLGWELYPKGFHKTRLGKWINTSINHNQHHQTFKGNYGLYFLFWDRWMRTLRTDYNDAYDEVSNRQKEAIQ